MLPLWRNLNDNKLLSVGEFLALKTYLWRCINKRLKMT